MFFIYVIFTNILPITNFEDFSLNTSNGNNNNNNSHIQSDNITITTSSNNNYYYSQLDNNSKIIYASLFNNIDNLKKENYIIEYSTIFNDLLHEPAGQYKLTRAFQSALDAFMYDHPELFYIDFTKIVLSTKCVSVGSLKTYMVDIVPSDNKNYLDSNFKSEQEVNSAIAKVENIKNSIIDSLADETTYNKIKMVHDLLVKSISYDTSLKGANIYNIYGAFIEKSVVCEGYAKAFKYLMDNLDIECILINGTAENTADNSGAHLWNYVKLNESWYGVDVTWDDPIGVSNNVIRHDYFLKGFEAFVDSHFPNGKMSDNGIIFSLPELSNNDF